MTDHGPRPTEAELWAAVEVTLRDVILPDLDDEWARASAVQLIGLAVYAQGRRADPTAGLEAELAAVLDRLDESGNELVASVWPSEDVSVMAAASRCLAAAVGRDDAPAAEIRSELRPVLLRQLDEELSDTAPLLDFFRGRLPDA